MWNQKQRYTVQGLVMCRDTCGIRKSEATATLSLSYPIRHTNTNMNTLTDTGANTNLSTSMNTITVQHLVMCSDICVHRIRRSRDIAEPRAPASPKRSKDPFCFFLGPILLGCFFYLSFFQANGFAPVPLRFATAYGLH